MTSYLSSAFETRILTCSTNSFISLKNQIRSLNLLFDNLLMFPRALVEPDREFLWASGKAIHKRSLGVIIHLLLARVQVKRQTSLAILIIYPLSGPKPVKGNEASVCPSIPINEVLTREFSESH
jgi:hypothetical protein